MPLLPFLYPPTQTAHGRGLTQGSGLIQVRIWFSCRTRQRPRTMYPVSGANNTTPVLNFLLEECIGNVELNGPFPPYAGLHRQCRIKWPVPPHMLVCTKAKIHTHRATWPLSIIPKPHIIRERGDYTGPLFPRGPQCNDRIAYSIKYTFSDDGHNRPSYTIQQYTPTECTQGKAGFKTETLQYRMVKVHPEDHRFEVLPSVLQHSNILIFYTESN